MNTNIARYIALPIVSVGILGGAALGFAGLAGATTTVTHDGPDVSVVTAPDTHAKPAPDAIPGWWYHHGLGHLAMFNQ